MTLEEISKRWSKKDEMPINPHKDVRCLIRRVKDLEDQRNGLIESVTEFTNRIKELEEGIRSNRESLSNFFPDNAKFYDIQKLLYKLIEK